jgi:hypothetical protein
MWKGIKIKDIILFVNLPFVHQRGMEIRFLFEAKNNKELCWVDGLNKFSDFLFISSPLITLWGFSLGWNFLTIFCSMKFINLTQIGL